MGTRSLTYFYETEAKKPFVCVYRQFDGYLSGHGIELAEFLTGHKLVNGFGMNDTGKTHANGMGCLAALMVASFKGNQIGNIYIMPASMKDAGQEYEYHVYDNKVVVKTVYGRKKNIFSGTWIEFGAHCAQKENENG